jgi:hypothetical protein
MTAHERFVKKKWIMDVLEEMQTRDVKLAIESFALTKPSSWSDHGDLVEQIVREADDPQTELLYETFQEGAHPKEPPMADLLEDEDNTPFSEAELGRIAEVLDEVKRQVAEEEDLPEQELQALDTKFTYLIEAAKHSRRKEWLIVAVTVISQPIVNGILTPGVVDKVLSTLASSLGPMFGHPMPMLGP